MAIRRILGLGEESKPLFWVGSSRKDLKRFPVEVRRLMGFALWQAQCGRKHVDAKPLKGFGGSGTGSDRGPQPRHVPGRLHGEASRRGVRASQLSEEVEEGSQNPQAGIGACPKASQNC